MQYMQKLKNCVAANNNKPLWLLADKDGTFYKVAYFQAGESFKLTVFENTNNAYIDEVATIWFQKDLNDDHTMHIDLIKLKNLNLQGVGIGTLMEQMMEHIAYKNGCNKLEATVLNTSFLPDFLTYQFYERNGFVDAKNNSGNQPPQKVKQIEPQQQRDYEHGIITSKVDGVPVKIFTFPAIQKEILASLEQEPTL